MSIVITLKEQSSLGFTGRINVLLRENGQFVGDILLKDGEIVASQYKAMKGLNALYRIVFDDLESAVSLKTVVEPEIIDHSQIQYQIAFENFKKEAEQRVQRHRDSKLMRPPNHLSLKIRPDFIEKGADISLNEFEILCSLVGKKTVGEIYGSLSLMESEITEGLVSLRRKNAFLVVDQGHAQEEI